ncbi:spore coat U domain-containing protein [Undibacterium sp. Di27W]|uniref:Csu type fimbrial protein n=1 Tax=Undibacterium sp. Di27W TaxID=3413036 RepID=UPI003BF3B96A
MRHLCKLLLILILSASFQAHALTCTVSTLPVTFSTYDPQSNTPSDISGTVTVTCTELVSVLVSYSVKLNAGLTGSMSSRLMTSGSSQLAYQLYTNSGRTTVWGDGTAGSSIVNDGYLLNVLTPVVHNYSVYGRISARQNVMAGNYLDTVTVLLTY